MHKLSQGCCSPLNRVVEKFQFLLLWYVQCTCSLQNITYTVHSNSNMYMLIPIFSLLATLNKIICCLIEPINEFHYAGANITVGSFLFMYALTTCGHSVVMMANLEIEGGHDVPGRLHGLVLRGGVVVCTPTDPAVYVCPAQFLCPYHFPCGCLQCTFVCSNNLKYIQLVYVMEHPNKGHLNLVNNLERFSVPNISKRSFRNHEQCP